MSVRLCWRYEGFVFFPYRPPTPRRARLWSKSAGAQRALHIESGFVGPFLVHNSWGPGSHAPSSSAGPPSPQTPDPSAPQLLLRVAKATDDEARTHRWRMAIYDVLKANAADGAAGGEAALREWLAEEGLEEGALADRSAASSPDSLHWVGEGVEGTPLTQAPVVPEVSDTHGYFRFPPFLHPDTGCFVL